jgi:hypothetical protein
MNNLINSIIISLIAVLFWILAYFVYDLGAVSHILLGMTFATIILNFFQGQKLRRRIHGKLF